MVEVLTITALLVNAVMLTWTAISKHNAKQRQALERAVMLWHTEMTEAQDRMLLIELVLTNEG